MRLRPPALCHQTGGPCCPAPWAQLAACPPGPFPRSPGGAHAAPHPPSTGLLPSCVPSLCWGCRGGPYIQQKPHHIGLAAQRRLVQGRARLGLPVDVDASLQQEPAGARRGQRGGGGTGLVLSPLPTAPGTHRMMSMWPFLAARCKGLVPLGSVVSPGLGSSSAAHMLLFRSSWTTWISKHRRSRAAKTAQPPAGAAGPHAQTPALRPATPWDVGAGGVPLLPSLRPPCAHPRVPLTPRASPGTPHSPSCL